jgi:endoglucanase
MNYKKSWAGCETRFSFTGLKMAVIGLAMLLLLRIAGASAEVVPLSVSGNKVLIGGQQGSIAGNSLFWSNTGWGGEKYYNASAIAWLKSDWKSTIVRAAMGVEDAGGYLADPAANKARVKAVIDAAIANDMYVIIDWHSHHAELYQSQAIAFFQEMATTYGNKNNVIYEIYNEPLAVSWSSTIKPYANAVIAAIRAIDPDNLIVVGTPTWSQDVDVAALDPITGYANIAYTLHFYAGSHGQSLRNKASTAMSRGVAVFVTEWGSVNADGGGAVATSETNAWLSYMQTNGISSANWAINDKAEGASALVPGASSTGGWNSSQLTASGSLVRSAILNWVSPNILNNPTPPVNLPATVQAESYASMSGVQTETTTDTGGGLNVGYIDAGDWMNYSNAQINIPATGTYKVTYRVASQGGGGTIVFKKADGSVTYDTVSVPSTGGWQTWISLERAVNLSAGNHSFSITASTGGFNINWFKVETLTPGSSSSSAASSSAPAAPLTTIQAEAYAAMSGVQTQSTSDTGGGLNVGYIDAGDWMSYTNHSVTIPSTGTYTIEYRVASLNGGGSLRFEEAGGGAVYGTLAIGATGGWQNWTTIKHTVTLSAGVHTFGINAVSGGWNFNWFRITPGAI